MTKTEKLARIERAGYIVRFHAYKTIKYVASKNGSPDVEARSVCELNRLIFGYN